MPDALRRPARWLLLLLLCCAIGACGENPPYPKGKVTTPVGRPGVCAYCGKKIEKVTKDNLVTIQGIRYVVCDKQCAAGQEERARHQ